MIEQSVHLASNGSVQVSGYEQLARFGYTKNRGVYRLTVTATGEWEGLTIRCFWHVPDGKDPASSLVVGGYVDVPASVTAQPGNGCITFEGSDGTKTVTSADLRYRVSANSGTEDGTEPEPGTPAWQQLVDAVHTDAAAAEQAKTDAQAAAQQAGMWTKLDGDLVVYDVLENGLRVRVSPEGDHVYGTLVQSAESAQWTSLDGKETRSFAVSTPVRMERRVPDLDYVTECDNRVWGCSSKENVIYACRLGDPTNWFSYRGIAADSYAVTVGSDGAFTGAATCMGYALFFKENTLHKLYGSKPSDFQLTSLRCRGVAKNAARSLCVLNETLYYLSPDGVMAWDGSIPTKVSGALDSGRLANVQSAVGSALDGRYYLHVARTAAGENTARLLVYDTERALWSEENVCSYEMTSTGGQLYLWDGQALWAADPSREADWQATDGVEEKLNFELTTGDIGLDGAEDRYLSRLTLRLDAECSSTVEVAASYDGGPWETVASLTAQDKRRSFDLPFVPRRHGTLRLRLKGRGQITLRSIAKTMAAAKGGIAGGEV